MAYGMTNVGGGGNFSATIHCTSAKANTTVTAVCGTKSYSATSNSSGVADIVVRKPGTYTVSTSERGNKSIVCADKGTTYNCPFRLYLYNRGTEYATWVTNYAEKNTDFIYQHGSEATEVDFTSSARLESQKVKSLSNGNWSSITFVYEHASVWNGLGVSYLGAAVCNNNTGEYSRGAIISQAIGSARSEVAGNFTDQDVTLSFSIADLDANTKYKIFSYSRSFGTNQSTAKLIEVYLS